MKGITILKQQGIGIIEVLITMAVVAFGLMAIATLQTDLISSSSDSKTRSEALTLAEQKIEEFRNSVQVGVLNDPAQPECAPANIGIAGYKGICSSVAPEQINGTNAIFTRTWTITNTAAFVATAPNLKQISVQIGWDADGNGVSGGTDDERVILDSEMAWINPADSAYFAEQNSGGTGSVPSPRQNASEDVASEKVIGDNMSITDLNTNTPGTAGEDSSLGADATDPDGNTVLITIYQIGPGSHYYTATRDTGNAVLNQIEPGVIAVFLCADLDNDINTDDVCRHIQNHFGGVVLRHTGTVYSTSSLGLSGINVAWTSSDVNACYNSPTTSFTGTVDGNSATIYKQDYECPFAGNCNATPVAERTRTATNFDEACYVPAIVSDAQINARHVGPGGEFGDVGLLGVKESTGNREEICFLEDTAAESSVMIDGGSAHKTLNEDYLFIVSKRFYVSRRIVGEGSINIQRSEGINRSYTDHNFLVIDRVSNNKNGGACDDIAIDNNLVIAPRNITRVFNENVDNNFKSRTAYPGIAGRPIVVTGNVVAAQATDLRTYIEEIGSCYIKSDNLAYACVVPKGTLIVDGVGVGSTITEIDLATGSTTVKTKTIFPPPLDFNTTPSTTNPTVVVKAGSKERPSAATPQSFAECGILPSATCNWTGSGFGNF